MRGRQELEAKGVFMRAAWAKLGKLFTCMHVCSIWPRASCRHVRIFFLAPRLFSLTISSIPQTLNITCMQRVWYYGIKDGFVDECFADPEFVGCLGNNRTYSQVSITRSGEVADIVCGSVGDGLCVVGRLGGDGRL